MRKFSSYGPINKQLHYYAPRETLIARIYQQLQGEDMCEGGQYMTVWAPRQAGKTWLIIEAGQRLKASGEFDVASITMEFAKGQTDPDAVLRIFIRQLQNKLDTQLPPITSWEEFSELFSRRALARPLILILDEFDAIDEACINTFAAAFRSIYIDRHNEIEKSSAEKTYLLHSVALIGVRSVLGIENTTGSPFNVQRSVHIPNLTFEEVRGMFADYTRESGQFIDPGVITSLYQETNGQPGLISWFGELLTEGFEGHQPDQSRPIGMQDFERVYSAAISALPNSNILNIISKTKQEPYKHQVLQMFRTDSKIEFAFDNPITNFLYMNGVIDQEIMSDTHRYMRFPCPFVQKRLFNYFSGELFSYMGKLYEPFESVDDILTDTSLNIRNLLRRYEQHLCANRDWMFKDVPRRSDLRIYEAVYHFNLYRYLSQFLESYGGRVYPEFPTGNGKIDLFITYADKTYGLELKSYTTHKEFEAALRQAAHYGQQLGLHAITLVVFVETIDDAHREQYEVTYVDDATGVEVSPAFVNIGTYGSHGNKHNDGYIVHESRVEYHIPL